MFDKEIDLLKVYHRLYPFDDWPMVNQGLLYDGVFGDLSAAEGFHRSAYEIAASPTTVSNLVGILVRQGKADEIERLAPEAAKRLGDAYWSDWVLTYAWIGRGNGDKVRGGLGRLKEAEPSREAPLRLMWLLGSGQLRSARSAVDEARSAGEQNGEIEQTYRAGLARHWLEMRKTGRPPRLTPQDALLPKDSLQYLRGFAAYSVDVGSAEPLEPLIEHHVTEERDSTNRFVREELDFARACVALVRGEAQKARDLLEPLCRGTKVVGRRRILARAYEALGMWDTAVRELGEVLWNPHQRWEIDGPMVQYEIPSAEALEMFHVARLYERLGNSERARDWYGRFLLDWKNADPDIPEVVEARERVAALAGRRAGTGR